MKVYGINNDGVHLMSSLNSEFSLCGDAFDIDSLLNIEKDVSGIKNTEKNIVTCQRCIIEILNCKNVQFKK